MNDGNKFDWFGFWVQFVCAAVFSAVFAGIILARYFHYLNQHQVLYIAAIVGFVCGLIAGFKGDRFWVALSFLAACVKGRKHDH